MKRDVQNPLYTERILEKGKECCITIFTPTYNRSKLLLRVYDCLKTQTCHNFVWLIVNDGSSDDTDEVVKELIQKNELPMRYLNKDNEGKHKALELGMNMTETDFFLDLDDDDLYTSDIVEFFLKQWNNIKEEGRTDIGAVRALTAYSDGRIVCNYNFIKTDLGKQFDSTTLEMDYVWGQHQENTTCYYISALRQLDLFPKEYWLQNQHTFLTEVIWQGRLARKYKCRYVYKIVRYYNTCSESLLRGRMTRQKALNAFINYHMILNEHFDYMYYNYILFIKYLLLSGAYRIMAGVSILEDLKHSKNKSLRLLKLCAMPISYLVMIFRFKKIGLIKE